jgi:DNA-binding beta-propeller fold protein YncE
MLRPAPVVLAVLSLAAANAVAQLAISANDNKALNVDGATVAQPGVPDTVSILDLGTSPPRLLAEVKAPASVVGPPQSVAIAPDESIALVTASTKIDPADAKKIVSDNKLSVIDLKANPPAVIATLEAGMGAAGVSFNPSGTLALVANRDEGTVSIFKVSGKAVTPAGKLPLGDAKSGPCHVAFLPDGKRALVTRDGDSRISILAIDGDTVTDTKKLMAGGLRPYSIEVSSKGDVAVFGNAGGGQGDVDFVSVVDLKAMRVVNHVPVGQTPEAVYMSADGGYVAVTVMNGSNRARSHPAFNDHGLVKVYRIEGTNLTPVAEANVGHWCQGAAWSRDGKTLAVQCMVEKELETFAFDGQSLRRTGEVKLSGGGAGIRVSTK